MKNQKIALGFIILLLSQHSITFSKDFSWFIKKVPSLIETTLSNEYYFSGENISYASVGLKYKDYPLLKSEISLFKTGVNIKNNQISKVRFCFDYVDIKYVGDFINLRYKLISINSNSSLFSSDYIEWVKVGFGLGFGGFLSDSKQRINFDVMPSFGTGEMSDKSKEFLILYFLGNIGYSSYKLDPEIVKPLADKMYLFDAASAFEGCINAGILWRISKNVMFNTAMNFYGYEKYDYQYVFLKLTGGFDVLLFYSPPNQYFTCSVNLLFNYFDLCKTYDYKNRVKFPSLITYSKYGINCGLNYHF